jgi:hypothetical protein
VRRPICPKGAEARQCLYLYDFASLEEARTIIGDFIERFNRGWLLERHGHMTPAEVRQELTRMAA